MLSCWDRVLIFGTPAEDLLPRGDDLEAILMGAVDYLAKPLAPIIHRRCYRRLSPRNTHSGVEEVAWGHIEAQLLRLEQGETNEPNEQECFPD